MVPEKRLNTTPTVADVFHYMYLASGQKFRFSQTLAELLQMDVEGLGPLYNQHAPNPNSPDFEVSVQTIASKAGCAPDILAHLLRRWTPEGAT